MKDQGKVIRSERYYGSLFRSFSLAQNVDQAGASAKYADGILELTLPKKVGSETKKLAEDYRTLASHRSQETRRIPAWPVPAAGSKRTHIEERAALICIKLAGIDYGSIVTLTIHA